MNPNNVLQNLSQGIVQTVVASPAVVVQSNPVVQNQQVATPAMSNIIDISSLNNSVSNEVSFDFTNGTGATVIVWFSGLFGGQGQAVNFSKAPGGVDFPAFTGTGPGPGPQSNGGQDLARFNATLIGAGPVIASRITVQSSTVGAQKDQRLLLDNNNISGDINTPSKLAGICNACFTNGVSTEFTTVFTGPFGVGGSQSVGYPVLDANTVTVRFTLIGQSIYSFSPMGNGSTNNGFCATC